MAKFTPPFSNTGPRRNPDTTEQANGFPCGPADQLLFNGMFHRIEAELGAVINQAGITQSESDNTQVVQAILALIDAATGGGGEETYLLLTQAAARLPLFPAIESVDGKINLSAPVTGTIRVPAGVTFMHRGIVPYVTAETDFATVGSKTYHLRWSPTGGFVLKDLADPTYNPGTLAEAHTSFDSKYDDMLVARVVTNAGNVATFTSLVNFDRLWYNGAVQGTNWRNLGTITNAYADFSVDINWARSPKFRSFGMSFQQWEGGGNAPGVYQGDHDYYIKPVGTSGNAGTTQYSFPVDRYGSKFVWYADQVEDFWFDVSLGA